MGWKGGKFEAHQCRYLGWTYLRWIGGFFLGSFLKKKVSCELMSGQPAFWGLHGSSVWALGFMVGIG